MFGLCNCSFNLKLISILILNKEKNLSYVIIKRCIFYIKICYYMFLVKKKERKCLIYFNYVINFIYLEVII